ncbi:MAG: hypothetical protein P1V34_08350 [Alphaproteobacteria bacterium]|nr:hypothetical protein [Alphaproteobacteria bacterium]
MPQGLDRCKRFGHGLDSTAAARHFLPMATDNKTSERERARLQRQAATLRANLLKRKAQQRARRLENQPESSDADPDTKNI